MSGATRLAIRAAAMAVCFLAALSPVAAAAEGDLSFANSFIDGQGGVDGLDGAWGAAVSPDDEHVYVAGQQDNALTAFERDPGDGSLTAVDLEVDGVNGVDGLSGVEDVVVSGDGAHVYAVAFLDGAISVFQRNATSGELTYLGITNLDSGAGPTLAAISPDDETLYVTAHFGVGLYALSRDPATGLLTEIDREQDGQDDPIDPGGTVDGLAIPQAVAVSPDGENVYVAGQNDDAVAVFRRSTGAGNLGKISFLEAEVEGVDDAGDAGGTVNGLNGAEGVGVSADGSRVYATSNISDALVAFDRDAATGVLSYDECLMEIGGACGTDGDTADGLNGAGLLEVASTTGPGAAEQIYIASDADALAAVEWDEATSSFDFIECIADVSTTSGCSDEGGTIDGLDAPKEPVATADGASLYATAYDDDAVAVVDRDPATGTLDYQDRIADGDAGLEGLDDSRSGAVTPDGEFVYVGSFGDDAITVFDRDPTTSELTYMGCVGDAGGPSTCDDLGGTVTSLNGPTSVQIGSDGSTLYATAASDNAVTAFAIDQSSGELGNPRPLFDSDPTVEGLGGPSDAALSPDGDLLYVSAEQDDAITALEIGSGGGLSFRSCIEDAAIGGGCDDGNGTITGLEHVDQIAVTDRGVFATTAQASTAPGYDSAVTAFSRAADGDLSFAGAILDDGGNPEPLAGAFGVAASVNGRQLYVAAEDDDAITTLAIDPVSQELAFVDCIEDGGAGSGCGSSDSSGALDGVRGLAASIDGKSIFATGFGSDSLISFDRSVDGALSVRETFGSAAVGAFENPLGIAVAPTDDGVYVLSQIGDSIAGFDRDPDVTAPDVLIDSGPDGVGEDATPTFEFSSTDGYAAFECRVDSSGAAAFGECSSPNTLGPLADGAHSFEVRAVDPAGNRSGIAARAFEVDAPDPPPDTDPPDPPPDTDPPPDPDPGPTPTPDPDPGPTPTPTPTPDTEVTDADLTADKKQKVGGKTVKIKLKVSAGERVKVTGKGTIKVKGRKGKKKRAAISAKKWKLKRVTKTIDGGKATVLRLKPKKKKDSKKILKKVGKGKDLRANVSAKFTDDAGNSVVEKRVVRLKPRR